MILLIILLNHKIQRIIIGFIAKKYYHTQCIMYSSSENNNDDILKKFKHDITILAKENRKLQNELIEKNSIINLVINQHISEKKTLSDAHNESMQDILTTYNVNIMDMKKKYDIFRTSLHKRLQDTITTHYKLSNEKHDLLMARNQELATMMQSHQDKLSEKTQQIDLYRNRAYELQQVHDGIESRLQDTLHSKQMIEGSLNELRDAHLYCHTKINSSESIIEELRQNVSQLKSQLYDTEMISSKNEEWCKQLIIDLDATKMMGNKHNILVHDLMTKQNTIDEKNLELIRLEMKHQEMEHQITILENSKKDQHIRITDYCTAIENLQSDISLITKKVTTLSSEKEDLVYQLQHRLTEYDLIKNQLREIETTMLSRIRHVQESFELEKTKYINDHTSQYENQILKLNDTMVMMQQTFDIANANKDQQIKSLMDHVKSFTENQYATFIELDKQRSLNEKMSVTQANIDQTLTQINDQHTQEMDRMKLDFDNQKNTLITSYEDTIKNAQDNNDILEERLNQTIEALTLSRSTISNIRDANMILENKINTKETEEMSTVDKYNTVRSELVSLREKLDKSVNLNNDYANRERQYETKIKQLQLKYNQVLLLTKKNMNNDSQPNSN